MQQWNRRKAKRHRASQYFEIVTRREKERERDSEEGKESRDCYGVTAMCCLNNLWSQASCFTCCNTCFASPFASMKSISCDLHLYMWRQPHMIVTLQAEGTTHAEQLQAAKTSKWFFLSKVSGLQSVPLTHDIVEILLGALGHPGTSFGHATTSSQLLETTYGGAIDRQVSQWLVLSLVWWFQWFWGQFESNQSRETLIGLHCKSKFVFDIICWHKLNSFTKVTFVSIYIVRLWISRTKLGTPWYYNSIVGSRANVAYSWRVTRMTYAHVSWFKRCHILLWSR